MERTKINNLFILFLVSTVIILWNLGTGSLTSWDEAVYAQVSREIFNSGNWVDLSWRGEPWSDKPPLYMWATAFFYKLFGVNEFSARLFSALCGIGTILLTYAIAYRLYAQRVAVASALFLISTMHFIIFAKMATLDVTLTFFMALAFFFIILGEKRRIYLFFSGPAFCCAFLTKSFGALLIPVIIAAYLLYSRKISLLKEPEMIFGILAALFILWWWHWLAFAHYGKAFVDGYFIKHVFIRATSAVEGHTGDLFNYFKVLSNKGRPWGVFAFLVVPLAAARCLFKKETNHFLPLAWTLIVFVVVSMVKTKLHWYIMPLYPAIAMLLGWAASKLFKKFTIAAVAALASFSLFYLICEKQIFNLDYSNDTKAIALKTRDIIEKTDKLFIYNVIDPALHFYCADIGRDISGPEQLKKVLQTGKYILFEREFFDNSETGKFSIVLQDTHFVIAKVL